MASSSGRWRFAGTVALLSLTAALAAMAACGGGSSPTQPTTPPATAGTSPAPRITGISPASPKVSSVEQTLIVTGTGFRPGLTANLGMPNGELIAIEAARVQNLSDTSLDIRFAFTQTGPHTIRATNTDGQQSNSFAFSAVPSDSGGPVQSAETDRQGNATIEVPSVGSVEVHVKNPEGAGVPNAVVAAAESVLAVGAEGYAPSVVFVPRTSATSLRHAAVLSRIEVGLRRAFCGSLNVVSTCTGDMLGLLAGACDAAVLEKSVFGCGRGPSLAGSNVVSQVIVLNAVSAVELVVSRVGKLASCVFDAVGLGGFDLNAAYQNLSAKWYPDRPVEYLTFDIGKDRVFTPFLCSKPNRLSSTGTASQTSWVGTLNWSLPNKLIEVEHVKGWTGTSCDNGPPAFDAVPEPTDPLREFRSLPTSRPIDAVNRSVNVTLAAGEYRWRVETTRLGGSTVQSDCIALAANPGSTGLSISSISPTTRGTGTFPLTINGSGYNPATVQIVVTGPECAQSQPCVVPNTALTTKTSNQLVGPVTINNAGTFTIQVRNGSSGALSNGAALTITAPSPTERPVLRIDGGTSSTKPIGQTFTYTGTGFTPGRTVTRYINPAVNGSNVLSPTLSADGAGNLSWTFTPACGNPLGTFTIDIVDDATGRRSNTVTQTVTASSSCNAPVLRIDGGTSSTKAIGQTFSYTGSGFTPGRTVTRYINPAVNGSNVLSPTLSADGAGNVSWTFTPACGNPLGTFTIDIVDDATGRRSNTVTQTVTANSTCR